MSVELEPRYHVPRSQVWAGSRGRQHGNVHLHVRGELHSRRLHRVVGAALCGRDAWWHREPEHPSERAPEALCPRCVAAAARHGLTVPAAGVEAATIQDVRVR